MYKDVEIVLKNIEKILNYPLSLDQVNRLEDLLIEFYNHTYIRGRQNSLSYYEESLLDK